MSLTRTLIDVRPLRTSPPSGGCSSGGRCPWIVGQAGPDLGSLRGGLVAGWSSGATALVSGGLLCLLAVTAVGATTPELRDGATPPDDR